MGISGEMGNGEWGNSFWGIKEMGRNGNPK